jgi:hypothetical protein
MRRSEIDAAVENTVSKFRMFGYAMLAVGGILFIAALACSFTPGASITIDGVPTKDF